MLRRLRFAPLLLAFSHAAAQTRGATQPVTFTPTFATQGQSVWGPAGTAIPSNTFSIVAHSWGKSGSITNFQTVFGEKFGPGISASTSGSAAFSFRVSGLSGGLVDVTYPVRVVVDVPTSNSFAPGDEIALKTSWTLDPGSKIATTPPSGQVELLLGFGVRSSATAEVCLIVCKTQNFFPPINIDQVQIPIITLTPSEMRIVAQPIPRPVPYTLNFVETFATGLSGTLDFPRFGLVGASVGADGRTITVSGSQQFVDMNVDVDAIAFKLLGLQPPMGVQTPEILGAKAGYETLDHDILARLTQYQTVKFSPTVRTTITFPMTLSYRVVTPGGTTVATGSASAVTLDVGNTLFVTTPAARTDPVGATPNFAIQGRLSDQVEFGTSESYRIRAGMFNLKSPVFQWQQAVVSQVCDKFSIISPLICLIYREVTENVTRQAPAINVDLGPLWQATPVATGEVRPFFSTESAHPGGFDLGGFNTVGGSAFALDPERPQVVVSSTLASGLATGTGPAGSVTQTITVENRGDVTLSRAQVADQLALKFAGLGGFVLNDLRAMSLTKNAAFNGTSAINTLAGLDAIPVGGSGSVVVNFQASAGGVYTAEVRASATSPIGTAVSSTDGSSFAVYLAEITPRQLHIPARPADDDPELHAPVITARIPSTAALDAAAIDIRTVRLLGIAPLRAKLVREKGRAELQLKFDRRAVEQQILGRSSAPLAPSIAAPLARLDPDRIAAALLAGGAPPTDPALIDAQGNRNGRFDIGDLRALVLPQAAAPTAAAPNAVNGDKQALTLSVTGALTDGTGFMAEDAITVEVRGVKP